MPIPRLAARAVVATLVAVVFSSFVFASSGQAAGTSAAAVASATEASVLPFLNQQLSSYTSDYRRGTWGDNQDPGCWACDNGGPATAAATAYVLGGRSNQALLTDAEQTINTAIASRQSASGGFVGPPGNGQSQDITTMFFGVEFGAVYYLLNSDIPPAMKSSWQRSLAAAAEYLIDSGATTWYCNGNINLGYTEFLWMVWHATGDTKFLTAYNASWDFTTNPPQSRFPRSGWVTVKAPTKADGSDGAGYFTESGPDGSGYDTEYSMLQLDVASRLYLLSGDARALRVANMLINMEMRRVNIRTWMLDTSDGTRHTEADRYVGFQTSAFAVLGLHAGRSDLLQYVMPQLEMEESWYPQTGQANAPGFRRAFGNSVSVIALAAAVSDSALRRATLRLPSLGHLVRR